MPGKKKGGKKSSAKNSSLGDGQKSGKRALTLYQEYCAKGFVEPVGTVLKKLEKAGGSKAEDFSSITLHSLPLRAPDLFAISKSLEHYTPLRSLCLWNIALDEQSLRALADFFLPSTPIAAKYALGNGWKRCQLTEFQLMNCKIDEKNAHLVQVMLRHGKNLELLILDYNALGSNGANKVFNGIAENGESKLRKLSLKFCELGDECIGNMAKAIATMAYLEDLDLSGNWISNQGLQDFCPILKTSKSLQRLDLSNNQLSEREQLTSKGIPLRDQLAEIKKQQEEQLQSKLKPTIGRRMSTMPIKPAAIPNKKGSADSDDELDASIFMTAGLLSRRLSKLPALPQRPGTPPPSSPLASLNSDSTTQPQADTTNTTQPRPLPEQQSPAPPPSPNANKTINKLLQTLYETSSTETHLMTLDLSGNAIGNGNAEAILQFLKTRKPLVVNKKAPPLAIYVTERIRAEYFQKIRELNKYMDETRKKLSKKGGAKKGKGGKKKKK